RHDRGAPAGRGVRRGERPRRAGDPRRFPGRGYRLAAGATGLVITTRAVRVLPPGSTTVARLTRAGLAVLVLLCGLTMLLGYANKARCTGPEFDANGRST